MGRSASKRTVEGPSNSPPRSPPTNRLTACATSRPSHQLRATGADHVRSRVEMAATTCGRTATEFVRTCFIETRVEPVDSPRP